ncbi:MAG: regulatory protein GemA [Desulfovibrio sp.]
MAKAKKRNPKLAYLAKVHIARKQLTMPEDAYRDMLGDLFGVESSSRLNLDQLSRLCDHFEKLGAVFTKRATSKPKTSTEYYHVPDGVSFADQKRFIAAMWHALGWNMKGLDTRCKKQFEVDSFVWLNSQRKLQVLAKDLQNRCSAKGLVIKP